MAERSEAVEEQAVRDASAGYLAEPDIATAENVPPGYKRTGVGVIPSDWEALPAREVGVFKGGTGFPITDQGGKNGKYPFFKVSDMNNEGNETFMRVANHYISEATRSRLGATAFPRESIVFAKVGAAVFLERKKILGQPSCIDNNMAAFVVDKSLVNVRYVHSLLLNKSLGDLVATTALPALNGKQLGEIVLPVPSLPEQRAIATALSDADALIESLDRLIAKKRAIKQAAMQQLLTGQTRLPGFTGEWDTKRLGDHVSFLKTGTNSRAELTSKGAVAYLHYGDIHVGGSATLNPNVVSVPHIAASKVHHLAKLAPGDLVFVDASEDLEGVGKSVEIIDVPKEGMVSGLHTIAARFDKDVLTDGFKAYLQFCPQFIGTLRRLAAGTKVLATNRQHIASVELRLPGVSEQKAIATILSDMDTEIEALERRRDKARQIKQGMMQQLLTGRVRLVVPQTTEPVAC